MPRPSRRASPLGTRAARKQVQAGPAANHSSFNKHSASNNKHNLRLSHRLQTTPPSAATYPIAYSPATNTSTLAPLHRPTPLPRLQRRRGRITRTTDESRQRHQQQQWPPTRYVKSLASSLLPLLPLLLHSSSYPRSHSHANYKSTHIIHYPPNTTPSIPRHPSPRPTHNNRTRNTPPTHNHTPQF